MTKSAEVRELFLRGVMGRSTYLRLLIDTFRPIDNEFGEFQLDINELVSIHKFTIPEVFRELGAMAREAVIEGRLPSFSVMWTDPAMLTTYTPEQVIQLRVESMLRGKGYLFFCLGADNPTKTKTQQVDPNRITGFYKLGMSDFFLEIARLTSDRTLTTDLTTLTLRRLQYTGSGLTQPADTVSAVVRQLSDRISAMESQKSPVTAWAKIHLINESLQGKGIQSFEQNPENDTPGAYRIYLSEANTQYTVLASCSDYEGVFTVVNIGSLAPSFFDINIYGINAGEIAARQVFIVLLSL